jgi:methylthioribose-1-phosphate isomerase
MVVSRPVSGIVVLRSLARGPDDSVTRAGAEQGLLLDPIYNRGRLPEDPMNVGGNPHRTIWLADDGWSVEIIDQTQLPHVFRKVTLRTLADAARAIREMLVRGAPLIGATAAYGMCLAVRDDPSDDAIDEAWRTLYLTRPTAVNLRWALDRMRDELREQPADLRADVAYEIAAAICEEDVAANRAIGEHGAEVLRAIWNERDDGEPLEVLTHCNAGWLATVDHGTALAPIYQAHDEGLPVHVWVDETRPRNQGASLTAWELGQQGVPHTIIVDNAGGHLMQAGRVHACITGTDRTTAAGDVCNKIGTYLKALAARDNEIPFYVAVPGASIDWTIKDGAAIPIEQREHAEVARVTGRAPDGSITSVTITPEDSKVSNYAFDVTPARLVTGLITERGVCAANAEALAKLYPEAAQDAAPGAEPIREGQES